ncbi:single-stranded DNA-binding protein [Nocardiopsis composta]|uniref:Single-strand DNA-binding protein n=1 Tax=Nocardiopsis composta TaxID=157465 RepID=A0A7W8QM21_9ACTN|nr:single-stranded DNA-binding protein [Nocardiopsis composta]MBB5431916.1 single-strand DNA-binding protein [Nocardiopsis composta]
MHTSTAAAGIAERPGHRNEVVLEGRVTAEPSVRELPSGDRLVTWRVTVARPGGERDAGRQTDSITCVSFRADIQDATRGWRIGDLVHVTGALRRRYRRSRGFAGGVVEVEASAVRVLGGPSGHRPPEPGGEGASPPGRP